MLASLHLHLDRPVDVRVPLLVLLESFSLLRFVRDAQNAVQLLHECSALQDKHWQLRTLVKSYRVRAAATLSVPRVGGQKKSSDRIQFVEKL